ncbi:cytochrome c oxidase subunit VB-domain-containing protein [Durotheca rogersii]|uniref:cytochrome c oxidase subunit VB-domain-containing protein n=1 Tax=Durotheca rogersii TaxID=419775 RepID=UPI0022201B0D|nr:cytochrome c oxidase subunit VB-domain-containing protein [Durotheca rogersii]KAI5856790.1 cytochrome c oxidase subunit VB-domain-containing protein [Durotheca rogersii]
MSRANHQSPVPSSNPQIRPLANPSFLNHHYHPNSQFLSNRRPLTTQELRPVAATIAMFLQRSALAVARRASVAPAVRRGFAVSALRRDANKVEAHAAPSQKIKTLSEIRAEEDLIGPGAAPGTVPTDLEQATGLERLEILGKMEGVDIFDMRPLDASRKGTLDNPILVKSAGDEQYAGCTGYPADSHIVTWLGMSRERPVERCPECGSVYKMEYIGPQDDGHGHHDHHGYEEPKTFADYVKPQYW